MSFDSVYQQRYRAVQYPCCYLQIVVNSVLGRTIGFEQPFLFTQNSKQNDQELEFE